MNPLVSWLRLQLTPGLGRSGQMRLIEHFGSPCAAIAAARRWGNVPGLRGELAGALPAADDRRLYELQRTLERLEVWLLTILDADYPPLLKAIPDPPVLLYGRGVRRFGDCLAIVGSRGPTSTGRQAAENLARELAGHGLTIVSGLARGIDGAAHRGALAAGGSTIAVLGCGIDRIYPAEHQRLYEQIVNLGTLLSEYLPGTEPLPGHFPGRNRIISGLARGTLVIEARAGSGSLITADFALEQGREVFAVPGSIDRPTSSGVNRLIKEGAHPVTESADLLAVLTPGGSRRPAGNGEGEALPPVGEPAGAIWRALAEQPRHVDELAGILGLTAGELSATLLHLELQGVVEQLPGARYGRARRPHVNR